MTLCDLIYEDYATEHGCGTVVKRCIPHDGVFLFEIRATYAKCNPCTAYYILGRTKKEAVERFANTMGWMGICSVRLIPPGEEAESILTDWRKMPMR